MKYTYAIRAVAFASAVHAISLMEGLGSEVPPGLQQNLESHLSYGDSTAKVAKLLDTSGIKYVIIQPLGLSPKSLREMGVDVPEENEKLFEKFSIRVEDTPVIVLGFDSNARLISYTKILHADKHLFGASIADAFGESTSEVDKKQQVRPTAGEGSAGQSKPNVITKGEAIARITDNLKFGDTVNDALQIFKKCGIPAKSRSLTFMTEDELKSVGSSLSDEDKAAFYYEINVEAELGVRLAFDYQKRLVQFQYLWRAGPDTIQKTIGIVEAARRSGFILPVEE
jgi:hypothetical protein